jgi:hypothetical protein
LAKRELSELLVNDRPVELSPRALVKAVKADDDERRQCAHASLLVGLANLVVSHLRSSVMVAQNR